MASSSKPSFSAPSSPQQSPPSPTPVPPTIPAPPPPPVLPTSNQSHLLSSFLGNLQAALRFAEDSKKWALILILPRNPSVSTPTSPRISTSTSSRVSRRQPWRNSPFHQPHKQFAPRDIADNFSLWRRTAGTQDAQRYTNFYPTDGFPHLALLDPRSGERLAVWGNVDGQNMDGPTVSQIFWDTVLEQLPAFLNEHSLDPGALGPAHHREKSWAVRTRRFSAQPTCAPLVPTAVMDDEGAAIAAAIAASLADNDTHGKHVDNDHQPSSEDDYPVDDDPDDMYSSDSMTQEGDESSDQQEDISVDHDSPVGMDITSGPQPTPLAMGQPVAIPSRAREPVPSSVESLSSSYLERMESCFRSSTNPALLESRRLRQEQDQEMARSLQEDRRRIREEEAAATVHASRKEAQLSAEARLPDEPPEDASDILTVAIRLPSGVRVSRRFHSFDKLASVADIAIAKIGCIQITEKVPGAVLKMPGVAFTAKGWNVALGELGLSKRTMFILNCQ